MVLVFHYFINNFYCCFIADTFLLICGEPVSFLDGFDLGDESSGLLDCNCFDVQGFAVGWNDGLQPAKVGILVGSARVFP